MGRDGKLKRHLKEIAKCREAAKRAKREEISADNSWERRTDSIVEEIEDSNSEEESDIDISDNDDDPDFDQYVASSLDFK